MKGDSGRDKAIDKLLAGRLSARLQDGGGDCPDAEILAAFVERTLSPGELRVWESHLAGCRFCQEHVAHLVRLSESDEIEEAAKPAPAKAKTAWFRWALAAPALVALVIAGLWQTGELRQFLKQGEPASVEAPEPPAPLEPAQLRKKEAGAKAPAGGELPKTDELNQEAPKETAAMKAPPRMSIYGSSGSRVEVRPGEGGGAGVEEAREPSQAAAQVAVPAAIPANSQAVAEKKADSGLAMESAPIDMAAGRPESDKTLNEAPRRLAKGSDSGVEFHGFIRDRRTWRAGPGGLIQKATPEGGWETRPSGVKVDLYGVSFASSKVGWAVGQGGTVLRTTDGGESWSRMPNPTSEDLVRVGAISESKVNIITRSGRTLQSSDGGRTWKPLG